jgi:ABC-type multidrug transport system permease subunit
MGPGYENATGAQRICSAVGSAAGSDFLDGDTYINTNFKYYHAHLWRYVSP